MPRYSRHSRSTIDELPSELRLELKSKLREESYGPLDSFVEWLASRGHTITRSSLGRWVKALRERDLAGAVDPEEKVAAFPKLLDLWERLEATRAEEQRLLDQIRVLTRSLHPDAPI